MANELNNPITMYIAPVVELEFSIASIKSVWGAITYTKSRIIEIFSSSIPVREGGGDCILNKKWIHLSASDGSVFMGTDDAAELLGINEGILKVRLKHANSLREFAPLFQTRLLFPTWTEIDQKFPTDLEHKKQILLSQVMETYQHCLSRPIAPPDNQQCKHYTRRESHTPLPLEHTANGKLYAILKSNPFSPPWRRGCFKHIYLAVDLQTLKLAAWGKIPIIAQGDNTIENVRRTIENEIAMLRLFHTDQFIKILHSFTYIGKDGTEKMSIMFEYCDSDLEGSMADLYRSQNHPIVQQSLWNILEDTCSAMAQMEQMQVHHHDIKPSNIFLQLKSGQYRAKLGDFGFAKCIRDELLNPWFCGSPEYLAPEFVQGHNQINAASSQIYRLQAKREIAVIRRTGALRQLELAREGKETGIVLNELQKINKEANFELLEAEVELKIAQARMQQGTRKAAKTIGDVWALGVALYQMREGKPLLDVITGCSSNSLPAGPFLEFLANITQDQIDQAFSQRIHPGSLEELNKRMLTVNPDLRINAEECRAEIIRMRSNGILFK